VSECDCARDDARGRRRWGWQQTAAAATGGTGGVQGASDNFGGGADAECDSGYRSDQPVTGVAPCVS
jgi:hypothetical protein